MSSADLLIALLSGVPLVALGLALLAIRPRQRPQLFFACFAILWGAQVILANLGRALDAPVPFYLTSTLLSYALLPPMYLFLVHFAVVTRPLRRRWVPTVLFGAAGLAAGVILAAMPQLVVGLAGAAAGRSTVLTLGPAVLPLFALPFYGGFYFALASLYQQYRKAQPGSPRHRVRGLLLALGLFVSYASVSNLLAFATAPATAQVASPLGSAGFAALFAAGSLLLIGLVAHLVLRPPPPEQRDSVLIAGFVVPALVAVASFATGTDTVGVWRLAAVGVIVYTLARHQLFDLDLRMKRLAGPLGDLLWPEAAATPDYLYQRKLDVYRVSLEQFAALEGDPEADAVLRRLRKQLGISDREHTAMAFMVRHAPPPAPTAPQPTGAPAPPPIIEPGAVLANRYRVDRLLGEGAHGRAYLAYDETAQREVVVKAVGLHALGGKAASLLLREARLLGGLKHPHIIGILDVLEGPREAAIVMEYADGGSLFALLKRAGKLGRRDAVRLLDEMLAGLEAAHAKGVVHRDIKPENILRTRDGTTKLADFGVARAGAEEGTALGGGAVGTLLYMSPEQVRGQPVDARSDLYAAAVVFHQALTGRFYLRIAGKDDFQVRQLILRGAPQLGLDDAALQGFLAKALAKDPDARFASAAEMRRGLAALAAKAVPA